MTFKEVLQRFRTESFTEREKGAKFEKLIKKWFQTDPRYADKLQEVWLWEEFPGKKDFGGKDLGIDLVAKTDLGDYWAIQCKCYDEKAIISKAVVDSFISTAHRAFIDDLTLKTTYFSNLIWVSTTLRWGANAEETLKGQDIPVTRINMHELEASPVDWDKLLKGDTGKAALREGKQPRKHQLEAMNAAHEYFRVHDRGKLIMACGTGKTYTSLEIIEQETGGKGLILFMVPSIALLGQSLNAWMTDTKYRMKAVCICSDSKASKRNDFDNDETSIIDNPLPATTNINSIKRQLLGYKDTDGLVVVFSTYQSIDVLAEAQRALLEADPSYGIFDYIVCDEAHRTTGFKQKGRDESHFTKIHNNDLIRGKKRLYMTATPRYYNDNAKATAKDKDLVLWSMNNPDYYGEEFFRIGFGRAVREGLLTDYKVLVLTISEDDIPDSILEDVKDKQQKEIKMDDASKLIGCINGLSKRIKGDKGVTKEADPVLMRRAVAFCSTIDPSKRGSGISSKGFAAVMPTMVRKYKESLSEEVREEVVDIEVQHIDGSMNAATREEMIAWLKEETGNPNECRILSNVRCLSEGVDVPALDAVLFVAARNSEVDVVQSVGRVMRTFHKGASDEKKYGYIIVPVVVPADMEPEKAMADNERFSVVWKILNALRAHDDEFNATVNKIQLNKVKPPKVVIGGIPRGSGQMHEKDWMRDLQDQQTGATELSNEEIARQLELRFGSLQDGIYAKMVEKVGDRLYWENWAKEIGLIAQKFIERIARVVKDGLHKEAFVEFLSGLQKNLNPSIDEGQAVEMLAQHMITRPVFDALFKDFQFVKNNAVSRSMQRMLELLESEAMEKDTDVLDKFYENVRMNVGDIDNLEGKQMLIKNLYEKFFKGAFPKTVDKLGIVYTPVECVDFIIHSVDDILRKEFNCCLSDENVHILDPFTGTGTFITRLLQSGLIRPEDLERKYKNEIHCNELVLLAYYIAEVNIESVFHSLVKRDTYLPFEGICLTDTFQTTENKEEVLDQTWFSENAVNVDRQKRVPVRVIISNPPYSVGQRSANDNAQNMSYTHLDKRIAETYAKAAQATNKNSLYDSYIKAFRWASDRISNCKDGGVVAFISNGAWIDGNAQEGFRKCLEDEYLSIYVLNLRGNQRTSGELSRREGGKIFGSGSRTPISITFLVKNPNKKGKATIYYHDIGDYLSREQKLKKINEFGSVDSSKLQWDIVAPNEKGDWINQRGDVFDSLIILGDKDDKTNKQTLFNAVYARGIGSSRDSWAYNYSRQKMLESMKRSNEFYNEQRLKYQEYKRYNPNIDVVSFIDNDPLKISWSRAYRQDVEKNREHFYDVKYASIGLYRPFSKQNLYFDKTVLNDVGPVFNMFPTSIHQNLVICVSGVGVTKDFSCIITDMLPDLELIGKSQCFPLYWYEENKNKQRTLSLFDTESNDDFIRRDGITDWILKEVRTRFGNARKITKETIFYYVYGLLHSPKYREAFAADLKKSLPRIPIVEDIDAFLDFSYAGKQLANLHLNYEEIPAYEGVTVIGDRQKEEAPDGSMIAGTTDLYAVKVDYKYYEVEKMRFPKKGQKDTIIYNSSIRIENIPDEAYEYIVNGKSAIEWIMERYQVKTDPSSLIKNDPNDWSREHDNPRYILDLLLSVINVSVQTMEIVKKLPDLKLE
ncbi:type ISP restriction/modification enzyme [Parabacteroides sp.]|uniref:DEAD/DEAH box helicase n=1 Tax=Parabacteroides sp. TaxID=1869337 RepID=UPI00257E1C27|nr:type ISP restriction/modification enzyme [Parabacteroides sp.]